ncbi:MAG: serine/threonine-protein kinase [Pirellulales bacterium]
MAIASPEQFVTALEKSNLLSEQQLAGVRREQQELEQAGGEAQLQNLAISLIRRGLLTRWQAEQLLAGRPSFYLGKYKLLDRIGKGGMGSVYRAEHALMGRTVALKVMARKLLKDRTSVARFRREVQLAASLNHPNIVTAHDADCVDDTHFLVMEYVQGRDLGRWIKQSGALPIAWTCECIRQAALGIQHAHERGLIHRDIKPSNLLVLSGTAGRGPTIKILDVGLARFATSTEDEGGLTQSGQIVGTPDYIAPEQAEDVHSADGRADIFSLGCTLFQALTGQLPFPGSSLMAKLLARVNSQAPAASSLRPEISAELDAVVAKMLARQPEDRFQTPAAVASALAPFAGGMAPEPPGSSVFSMPAAAGGGTASAGGEAASAGGEAASAGSGSDAGGAGADPLNAAMGMSAAMGSGSDVVPADADSGLNEFLSRLSTSARSDSDSGETPTGDLPTLGDLVLGEESVMRRLPARQSSRLSTAAVISAVIVVLVVLMLMLML